MIRIKNPFFNFLGYQINNIPISLKNLYLSKCFQPPSYLIRGSGQPRNEFSRLVSKTDCRPEWRNWSCSATAFSKRYCRLRHSNLLGNWRLEISSSLNLVFDSILRYKRQSPRICPFRWHSCVDLTIVLLAEIAILRPLGASSSSRSSPRLPRVRTPTACPAHPPSPCNSFATRRSATRTAVQGTGGPFVSCCAGHPCKPVLRRGGSLSRCPLSRRRISARVLLSALPGHRYW